MQVSSRSIELPYVSTNRPNQLQEVPKYTISILSIPACPPVPVPHSHPFSDFLHPAALALLLIQQLLELRAQLQQWRIRTLQRPGVAVRCGFDQDPGTWGMETWKFQQSHPVTWWMMSVMSGFRRFLRVHLASSTTATGAPAPPCRTPPTSAPGKCLVLG